MFPLYTTQFPSSARELEEALNRSVQRLFCSSTAPVNVRDSCYPHVEAIQISLDGAKVQDNPPPAPSVAYDSSSFLEVDRLSLSARPFSIGSATIDLSFVAEAVRFGCGLDSNQQIILLLENAAHGELQLCISQTNLAALIAAAAQRQASKHGITVDGVQLDLQSVSSRSVAAQIRFQIRKLFVRASLSVSGQLSIDDQFNLKPTGLVCRGDGAIANLACGVLTPYLRRIETQPLSLMFLPLGQIKLHDINLALSDNLFVTAKFGSAVRT